MIILAFILSEGVETPMQDGKVLSAAGSRWVETGIRTFHLLTLIAVGIMIFNSVRKLVKKVNLYGKEDQLQKLIQDLWRILPSFY